MFGNRRIPRDWHLIDAGRVGCPIRGDLDIDYCAGCNHLVDLVVGEEEEISHVVCRPPRAALDALRVPGGF